VSAARDAALAAGAGRFKPYPAYKDSGIEWLGEIPAGWEAKPLKHLTAFSTGWTPPTGREDLYDGDNPWANIGDLGPRVLTATEKTISDSAIRESRLRIVKAGSLLFSFKLSVGTVSIAGTDMYTNEAIAAFAPSARIDTQYLYWAAPLLVPRNAQENIYGAPLLSRERIATALLLSPSIPEQRAIAAFLDRETARIDALVAKKERLIALLQEQRTALITRAVTKSLDLTVPMKDSGVEWLGEIPAHWEVLAVKRRAKRIQTGTTPPTAETEYYEDGVVAWYGPGSFADDLPLKTPAKYIAEKAVRDGVARVFESGTAAIVTIGATIGKVGFMERAGSFNQQITGVTFDGQHVDAKYGAYQLKRLEPVLRGIAPNTTLPILDQEEVGYLPFVVPPHVEQRAIAAFLDRETARIDDLVAKIREAIERLKELRTALISAAVTGKVDVREEVALDGAQLTQ